MSFDVLGLAPELVRVVADEGYTQPTPVQREAIPIVLAGRDLLATAQTGTGKTAAFVLPLLQRLWATAPAAGPQARQPVPGVARGRTGPPPATPPVRALVLTPTRELALQVEESIRTYGRRRPIRSVPIYGGVGFEPQVRALRAGPGIVVATPGRLLDHVGQRTIDLSAVEVLILDEADRMLDMGFIRDIRRVIGLLPDRRQNLLFSATFSDDVRALAEGLLDRPASVDVAPRNTAAELVEQRVMAVDRERKRELLSHLVRSGQVSQALVFTRTKHGADRLAGQLERDGIRAAAIHGNKSQGQRVRALEAFKQSRVDVLVATDVAARGIDIDSLPFVVNYELPMVASDYVHRIGRTGRAGVGGRAVSLVCVDEALLLRDIERLLGRVLPTETVAGFEPDRSIRPEPIRLRSAPGERPARDAGVRHAARPMAGAHLRARPARAAYPASGTSIGARPAGSVRPAGPIRPAGPMRPAVSARPHLGAPPRVPIALPGERLSRATGGSASDRPTGAASGRQAPAVRPHASAGTSVGAQAHGNSRSGSSARQHQSSHPSAGRNRR